MDLERGLNSERGESLFLPLGAGASDHDIDIDSDDEMMAQHSLRRGLMEQRSVAKTMFSGPESIFGYSRIRGRLMMPTDLDKWSRDQKKYEFALKQLYEHDGERLSELHQFVVAGGSMEQRAKFEEVIGWAQDQAIPGREDSLDLLIQLQKPMVEVGAMNSAFSALVQHVEESNDVLNATLEESQHELEARTHKKWIPELLNSIPSIEQLNSTLTDSETAQLALSHQDTWKDVSGFHIDDENKTQSIPLPNTSTLSKTVAIAVQSTPITKPAPTHADIQPLLDIHEGIRASSNIYSQQGNDYWSAEDEATV